MIDEGEVLLQCMGPNLQLGRDYVCFCGFRIHGTILALLENERACPFLAQIDGLVE